MGSSNRVSSNEGLLIFHSNYDTTPIRSEASSRINLKETTNLCRADDGYLTACSGWENLIKIKKQYLIRFVFHNIFGIILREDSLSSMIWLYVLVLNSI